MEGTTCSFESLTYREYYTYFRLVKFDAANEGRQNYYAEKQNSEDSPRMHVVFRSPTYHHLTRIHHVRPSDGDVFYLRTILLETAAFSFTDARTVHCTLHPTYQEAAKDAGLFTDHSESTQTLQEAIASLHTPRQLRWLFADLLANNCIEYPLTTWQQFHHQLCYDFFLRHHNSENLAHAQGLLELQNFLTEHGLLLGDFGLPQPDFIQQETEAELQRWADHTHVLQQRAEDKYRSLNDQQCHVFDMVWNAIQTKSQLLLFLDGKAGVGKTTVVNNLCDAICAQEQIALPTATSAFAAQLYSGGRTTHSVFKVFALYYTSTSLIITQDLSRRKQRNDSVFHPFRRLSCVPY